MRYLRQLLRNIPFARAFVLKFRYKRYLQTLRHKKPVGNGPKILIINHHFDQDIQALTEGCAARCTFFVVDCMPFFNRALLYFKSDEERDGIVPYPELPRSVIEGYRKVARELYDDLFKIFAFEAIITPSDSFWWVREFLNIAKESRRPTIVLDKEGMQSPYGYEVHPRQIRERFPFMSDYLIVWSERQKQFWINAGAPPDCIQVLGQPRSDFFFMRDRWVKRQALGLDETRKVVLFFTFDIDAYIHIYPAEEIRRESLSWLPLRNEINDVLIAFAKEHRSIDIVIKTHPQQSDIAHITNIFHRAALPNIKVMEGAGISNQLIVNADLIIGFQTTALIEALLTCKPVIYTGWSGTEKKLRDQLIPFHTCKGLQIANSELSFRAILDSWVNNEDIGGDRNCRKEFTDRYLGADGKVCERVAESLTSIVKGSR